MRGVDTEPDPETVTRFISWFETENNEIFQHVLNWLALNEHLGRYISSSPIQSVDPIQDTLMRHIDKFNAVTGSGLDQSFRHAVQKRLCEDGYLELYMNYDPPAGVVRSGNKLSPD